MLDVKQKRNQIINVAFFENVQDKKILKKNKKIVLQPQKSPQTGE